MIVNKWLYNFILKKIGHKLTTKEEVMKFRLAMISLPHFCEYFFSDPDDPNKPLKFSKGQKRIALFMQRGKTKGAILNSSRGAGKTIGCCAAAAALLIIKSCSVGIYAINLERAVAFMRHVKYFIKYSIFAELISRKIDSKTEVLLGYNNSYCRAHPASEGVRGGHFNYGFIDEASRIDSEILKKAIYSVFRRKGIHWIMLSTPAGMQGTFYDWWKKSGPGLTFTRLRIGIEDQDWLEWTVVNYNKEQGTDLSIEEYLRMEKEIMGELTFRQEILAEFLSAGAGVFNMDWVEHAMRGRGVVYDNLWESCDNKRNIYALGADFGKYHSNSVICIGHKDSKGFIYIDYIRTYENIKEYEYIENEIIRFMKHWNIGYAVLDSTGIGDPIFERVQKKAKENKVRGRFYHNKPHRPGFVFDIRSKPALIDQMVRVFENKKVYMPWHFNAVSRRDKGWEIYELVEEMRQFSYEILPSTIKYSGSERDDRVIATALMIWGLKKPPYKYISPALG